MKKCLFLLFAFSFVSCLYAQNYSVSDINDCHMVYLKCEHIHHNNKPIEDNNEYIIRIETKEGPAGWIKVWLNNKGSKKSDLPFQSPRNNCWAKKNIIKNIPQQSVLYVFGRSTNNGKYKFDYFSYNLEDNISSVNGIGIFDKNNNEIIDTYLVLSCDFYHKVQGRETLKNGITISYMEDKVKISNYNPNFKTYNNLLTKFFADIYEYYR